MKLKQLFSLETVLIALAMIALAAVVQGRAQASDKPAPPAASVDLTEKEQQDFATINGQLSKLNSNEKKAQTALNESDEDIAIISAVRQLRQYAAERRLLQIAFFNWLGQANQAHNVKDYVPSEDGKKLIPATKAPPAEAKPAK